MTINKTKEITNKQLIDQSTYTYIARSRQVPGVTFVSLFYRGVQTRVKKNVSANKSTNDLGHAQAHRPIGERTICGARGCLRSTRIRVGRSIR